MTIQEAIKKAQEQGYRPKYFIWSDWEDDKKLSETTPILIDEVIFLDSLFWEALGKSLRWSRVCGLCGDIGQLCSFGSGVEIGFWQDERLYHWHRFIDHLAEGKSIESFFKELK